MIKVTDNKGSPSKTTSTIEFDIPIPKAIEAKVKKDVGDFIVEQVLQTVSGAESPVQGEGWPKLSKAYKKVKLSENATPEANMELHGDMLDSLTFKPTKKGLEVGFFDSEAWKADGHLKFSGKENGIPKRRFLPGEGQEFKTNIQSGIESIIADNLAEVAEVTKRDLKGIETKAQLYAYLSDQFSDLSKAEIRLAVLRSAELTELLDDADLLNLL